MWAWLFALNEDKNLCLELVEVKKAGWIPFPIYPSGVNLANIYNKGQER